MSESAIPDPEVLATMPLHMINEVHGADGLRARFLMECERFADRDRISAALELATALHRDDRRVREPYISHLLRVATRIVSHYGVHDSDVVVAALLHDAVEDHPEELAADRPGPPRTAALAELADRFGDRVAKLVAAVTNPEPDPGREWRDQYRDHLAESLEHNPWARIIKLSDFTDNGVGIGYVTGPKAHKLAAKYRPMTDLYRDLLARADTPLSDDAKALIRQQLDSADTRLDAILNSGG